MMRVIGKIVDGVVLIDRVTMHRETELDRDIRAWKKGGSFPYWLYSWKEWPVPFHMLVSADAVFGHCPDCGSAQQIGSRDEFPETYSCGRCGRSGRHPLWVDSVTASAAQ